MAGLLRAALRVVETGYAGAIRWRNRRYDSGAAPSHRVGVPVVSVGNLTLGGTGKTPMVHWIARSLEQQGVRVAIVSRGYGAADGGANDEAVEMRRLLPNVPHVQNPNRVAAARKAIANTGCQLILLDDGFQHRRLARDLDIVLLDALEPFGYGHVFPRGLLREPIDALRRADAVVLSRADLVAPSRRTEIWQTVRRHAPEAIRAEVMHAPKVLVSADGKELPLGEICEKPVAAFCGIGNPEGFRRTLESCGCQLAAFREFPDHHRYTPSDLEQLAAWCDNLGVEAAICTGKDLAKLAVNRLAKTSLWSLQIEMDFLAGQDELASRLRTLCPLG
ncbi:MAG: tetraacyldisaccharide 4'-kinase [Planctomycetaceae bacterium]|nr:tetraacyldisaccharide 4'-kinase [Planctomycetaceae bacterium]